MSVRPLPHGRSDRHDTPRCIALSRVVVVLAMGAIAQGCGTIREIGHAPALAPVELPPVHASVRVPGDGPKGFPHPPTGFGGSLWSAGARPLHADDRARHVGDLLTVVVAIDESGSFRLRSSRARDNASSRRLSAEATLNGTLVEPNGEANLTFGGSTDHSGQGRTSRDESVFLRIAAHVAGVQPNGNLVVRGSQEVRLNHELRRLTVEGVVRPRDLRTDNTVLYDRMAGARISYGGRGRLSEVQQPPVGQQLLDIVSPI